MLVAHTGGNGNTEYTDIDLFRCDQCKKLIQEENIKFKVDRFEVIEDISKCSFGEKELIIRGTLCRFCPTCFKVYKIPDQVVHRSLDSLSDELTYTIIKREKNK